MYGYYHTSQGLKDSMDYQFLQVPFLKFMLSPVFTLVQRLLWVDFCWKNHCIEVRHLGFHHSMFWPSFRENLFLEVFPVVCSCFQLLSSSLDFLGVYKLLSKLNLWQSLVGFGLQWVWKNEKNGCLTLFSLPFQIGLLPYRQTTWSISSFKVSCFSFTPNKKSQY